MDLLWRLGSIAALGCLLASPVAAVQIIPIQDGRSVSWILRDGTFEEVTPGPGFPDFDDRLVWVGGPETSQNSSIGTTDMSGVGAVFVNTDDATNVRSDFDISFRVDETVQYALSGISYSEPAQVLLFGPSGVIFDGTSPQTQFFSFSDNGTLSPGVDYRLLVALEVPDLDAAYGEWEFTFGISAVPEPSHGLMLIGALLVAGARRRGVARAVGD